MADGGMLGRGPRKGPRCMLTVLLSAGLGLQKGKGLFGSSNCLGWGKGQLFRSNQSPWKVKQELSDKTGRGCRPEALSKGACFMFEIL